MPPAPPLLEIACFSFESARRACRGGADRIELCRDRDSGGLTPPIDILKMLKIYCRTAGVAINVMIRVKGGTDFTASRDEIAHMQRSILQYKPYASGFVFGILDEEDNIDSKTNWVLTKLAYPRPCTFHRAFDYARGDLYEKLETVRRCGFKTILTGGGRGNAVDNIEPLKRLVSFAKPMEMTILVGGGVRMTNISKLESTEAEAYHTAAITDPSGDFVNECEVLKMAARHDDHWIGKPRPWSTRRDIFVQQDTAGGFLCVTDELLGSGVSDDVEDDEDDELDDDDEIDEDDEDEEDEDHEEEVDQELGIESDLDGALFR